MKTFTYKNYRGTSHYTDEDNVYHGKLLGIKDTITYQSETEAGLYSEFLETCDDYERTLREIRRL